MRLIRRSLRRRLRFCASMRSPCSGLKSDFIRGAVFSSPTQNSQLSVSGDPKLHHRGDIMVRHSPLLGRRRLYVRGKVTRLVRVRTKKGKNCPWQYLSASLPAHKPVEILPCRHSCSLSTWCSKFTMDTVARSGQDEGQRVQLLGSKYVTGSWIYVR